MNNSEAAKRFLELADLVDLAGELPFKASSYRKVAQSLINLNEPFVDIVKENSFNKIPGAGKAIKEKLRIMAETGKLPALEKWHKHEVSSFYPWLSLYNLRPRPLGILIRRFKATDFKGLLKKLKTYDLEKLSGQSKKTAHKILNKSSSFYD